MGKAYVETKKGEQRDEKGQTRYYKDWRTHQMSDHLLMWIELKTDFGGDYLDGKIGTEPERTEVVTTGIAP